MNLLFTICARAGSKGVKNKNIRKFEGVPIVNYTLSAYALFCDKYKDEYDSINLALNTDSKELIKQVEQSGIKYYLVERKEDLAGDVVSKISVIKDTLVMVEEKTKETFDYIVDLDVTSPLRSVEDIKGTIDVIIGDKNADISYSVTDARRSPYFNMVSEDTEGYYNTVNHSNYICRQQSPCCYDMNASIYAYAREYLLSGRTGKRNALIWIMEDTGILDIDSERDLELLEVIATYLFKKDNKYKQIWKKASNIAGVLIVH